VSDKYESVRSLPFPALASALGIDLARFKRRKEDWQGYCPVHQSKTNNNCFAYHDAGKFHCFSCNAKGAGAVDLAKLDTPSSRSSPTRRLASSKESKTPSKAYSNPRMILKAGFVSNADDPEIRTPDRGGISFPVAPPKRGDDLFFPLRRGLVWAVGKWKSWFRISTFPAPTGILRFGLHVVIWEKLFWGRFQGMPHGRPALQANLGGTGDSHLQTRSNSPLARIIRRAASVSLSA
jgi:hypothetical protein